MSAASTLFTGRCPHCHEAPIFKGVYAIEDRCPRCGVVFLRDEGNWIGATVVSYMLGSVWALGVLVFLWATGRIMERGIEYTVVGSTVVVLLVTFRLVKGFWVGLLYDWGYVYADEPEPDDGAPSPAASTD